LISAKETPRFQRFHLFVPSLSWQKDRFTYRNGSKKATFFCTVDNNLVVKVAHELLCQRGKVRRAAVALDKLDLRHPRLACAPKKRISLCEVSLCLSRACLGKLMRFQSRIKWRAKECVFLAAPVSLGLWASVLSMMVE
jgi:hypothetical protein